MKTLIHIYIIFPFLAYAGVDTRRVMRSSIWASIPSSTGGRIWLLGHLRHHMLLIAVAERSELDEAFVLDLFYDHQSQSLIDLELTDC